MLRKYNTAVVVVQEIEARDEGEAITRLTEALTRTGFDVLDGSYDGKLPDAFVSENT